MIHAHVAHRLPGRLRLRSDDLCGEEPFLRRVEQEISGYPGVARVSGNATTGSVLIEYDPGIQSEAELIGRLADSHDFSLDGQSAPDPSVSVEEWREGTPKLVSAIQFPFRSANRALLALTDGYLDLRYSVPVAFVVLGTAKILRTSAQPGVPWYMYYWMAFHLFSIFRMLDERESTQRAKIGEPSSEDSRTSV